MSTIEPLNPEIIPLKPLIEPLEQESTDGADRVITLNSDILFDFGRHDLSKSAAAKIVALVSKLPDGTEVRVEGHTDSVPSSMGNDVLSQKRAQAVADAITAARADLTLTVKGFGESKPIEPNEKNGEDNPEGRAKNRRVEIRSAA
ncbi:OmpA family protein [Helcobacillus massiliensis]|uniref:Outer membrane protein OmpA-like peptidoglycan-associated protein n=1 Tax=Helcobacillus massiliensis TaxID=521392 RepID=A0A839QSH9_9MICO|nr:MULTISPECIES: OmpA family protein [Helcobacillus]MBB3023453.1 outer membrane protein OmpA-like peptidoglycan-associated protein [Helcobacillus massiliensis]MCG7427372.1 OmpA family protein [Helcobacillus sp. ACRRO]MCT1557941.1 OmpA family protein [Helcobacillus massiliensis]MCT2037340.1 OmpA family protein [Helcobacillus massiliensis]MCT2332943.1 OmpA family protein [Helcobacillus massiliensis]